MTLYRSKRLDKAMEILHESLPAMDERALFMLGAAAAAFFDCGGTKEQWARITKMAEDEFSST